MKNQEVSLEGQRKIRFELLERGAASVRVGATRKVYLHATNSDGTRTVVIRVKTKRKGNWHSSIKEAKRAEHPIKLKDVKNFWIFVDIGGVPRYWIVPDWWMRNNIYEEHQKYLNQHGGHRARNDSSEHHAVKEEHLKIWQNKWDILDIF